MDRFPRLFSEYLYLVTFIDEGSRYLIAYHIMRKSDVLSKLTTFRRWFERQFSCTIKKLHSDAGGHFIEMKSCMEERVIEHYMVQRESYNLNGITEKAKANC